MNKKHTITVFLIPLTQGQKAIVSAEDYDSLTSYKWYAHWDESCKTYYAKRNIRINNKRSAVLMHREIMKPNNGCMYVDHINHNGLDNRRENLRICTNSQNKINSYKQANNTSGYKGVRRRKDCNRWEVCIQYQYKKVYFGLFQTPEEAAKAYDAKAIELFGEYALINDISKT